MASTRKSGKTTSPVNTFRNSWLSIAIPLVPLLGFTYFQWQSGAITSLSSLHSLFPEQLRNSGFWSTDPKADVFDTEVMRRQYAAQCPDHSFKTHIFSTDPLIIYIEDYLSQDEARYLLKLAIPHYKTSPVSKGFELEAYSKDIRSSESAVLPYDAVVSCIEARSVDFQGYQPLSHLEDIQVWQTRASQRSSPILNVMTVSGVRRSSLSSLVGSRPNGKDAAKYECRASSGQ
ncbi:hypothetical protein V490_05223 [Pseudogymnoascus sp. VKM F-3557]|nr:hypothetical protein V490_05223 [Pseudogymnoascus sp. VKM F-3557]